MYRRRPIWWGCLVALVASAGLVEADRASSQESKPTNAPRPPPRPASLQKPASAPAIIPPEDKPVSAPEGSGCVRMLAGIPGNRVRPIAPAPKPEAEGCRVVDPVVVEALAVRTAAGPGQVKLVPPPTLSCELARAVSLWLDSGLQPLARGTFGRELTALRVGGGHECRRRNRQASGTLSEHATGQALDIFAFELGEEKQGGAVVVVERPKGLEQSRFLDGVRQSACGAFMTVLGPGADAAHANHLHVDIQQRRAASSRFCQ
jgi:hypothetical protein